MTLELREKDNQIEMIERENLETEVQLEEDADREILELQTRYEKRLRSAYENIMQLKGENAIKSRKQELLQKELRLQDYDKNILVKDKERLNSVISNLEKDVQVLKKDIKERDTNITEKENKIGELKKKNMELEKFKFVLDYKIKELKKQIEPRELEITAKSEQILKMEDELESFYQHNNKLELEKVNSGQKLKVLDNELRQQKQKCKDYMNLLKTLAIEITKMTSIITEPNQLKQAVKNLHEKISSDKFNTCIQSSVSTKIVDIDAKTEDQKVQDLLKRQKEHLEKSLETLREKNNRDNHKSKSCHRKIMQENVTLIAEINELRKNLKSSRMRISDLETKLGIKAAIKEDVWANRLIDSIF